MSKDPRRSFQDVLTDMDDGRLHEQLTDLLPKVVAAVKEANKPGSLTLTLSIAPEAGSAVVMNAKVSSKLPAPGVSPTFFYSDDKGNPHRNDPKQQQLKLAAPVTPIDRKKD